MNDGFSWEQHGDLLITSIGQTLYMVGATLVIGGLGGLVVGMLLYISRPGGLVANRLVFWTLNTAVNIIRPIPFIVLLTAVRPLTREIVGSTFGSTSMLVPLSIAATFGFARIVEQNLVSIDPGIIEAARATGATRLRIVFTLIVPEALGPLILGTTFLFVALVDMSAVAGLVAGGGLGDMALQYGYRRFNDQLTWVVMLVIIVIVQIVQALGNTLARKYLRRG